MTYLYILLILILVETSYLVLVNQKKISKKITERNIYIDTSVLIDGRIVSVAETGFLGGVIQIPKSVVAELQLMADGTDSEKRSRARHGLDIIAELQKIKNCKVNILQDNIETGVGVDDQLIFLAKQDKGSALCTLDFNLNKVATVEGISVGFVTASSVFARRKNTGTFNAEGARIYASCWKYPRRYHGCCR